MSALGHIATEVFNVFLVEAADQLGQWDEACCALERGNDVREALLWILRTAQNLRRASRGVGLDEFAQSLSSIEDLLREILRAQLTPQRSVLDTLSLAHSTLSRWLVGVRTDSSYVEDITHLSDAIRICRSEIHRSLLDSSAVDVGANELRVLQPSTSIPSVVGQPQQLISMLDSAPQVEEIINTVGNLVNQQKIVTELLSNLRVDNEHVAKAFDESRAIAKDLQEKVVHLRKSKLKKIFDKVEDYVLDLGEERGIALQFDYEGTEIEIDYSLVDDLWKAITHTIVLASDYNFDSPEERIKKGKIPTLSLKLSAKVEKNLVVITFEDDGRGLEDFDSTQSPSELRIRLMQIRKTLRSVSGTLTVVAQKNKFSSYRIAVPESLRLMDLIVVQTSDQTFALPAHVIDEVLEPGQFYSHTVRGDKQFIERNTKIIPYVSLHELLDGNDASSRASVQFSVAIEKGHVVVVRCGDDVIALGIDRVISHERSIVTPLSPHLRNVRGLFGTLTFANENPVLILDVIEISNEFWRSKNDREAA